MHDDVCDDIRYALLVARAHVLIAWLRFRGSVACLRIRFGVWLTIAWLTITMLPPLLCRTAWHRLRSLRAGGPADLSDEVPTARQTGV